MSRRNSARFINFATRRRRRSTGLCCTICTADCAEQSSRLLQWNRRYTQSYRHLATYTRTISCNLPSAKTIRLSVWCLVLLSSDDMTIRTPWSVPGGRAESDPATGLPSRIESGRTGPGRAGLSEHRVSRVTSTTESTAAHSMRSIVRRGRQPKASECRWRSTEKTAACDCLNDLEASARRLQSRRTATVVSHRRRSNVE